MKKLALVILFCGTLFGHGLLAQDIFTHDVYGNQYALGNLLAKNPSAVNLRYKGPRKAENGWTLLHYTVHAHGSPAATQLLLDKGADPNARSDNGEVPLHVAAQLDRFDKAPMLLAKGGDPNIKDKWGFTPVHAAIKSDHYTTLEILLQGGGKTDVKTKDGKTALALAIYHHSNKCV